MKPVTGSLKTTVKLIGLVFVGSGWAAAWLIVTLGAALSQVTVLSVEVDAAFALPAASVATPAPIEAMTVPGVVIPVTATLNVVGPPVTVAVVAPAVPERVTSPVAKPTAVSLKTTVKLTVAPLAGSSCAAAWLIVTVGAVTSHVTVLSVEVEAALALPARSFATPAARVAVTVP